MHAAVALMLLHSVHGKVTSHQVHSFVVEGGVFAVSR